MAATGDIYGNTFSPETYGWLTSGARSGQTLSATAIRNIIGAQLHAANERRRQEVAEAERMREFDVGVGEREKERKSALIAGGAQTGAQLGTIGLIGKGLGWWGTGGPTNPTSYIKAGIPELPAKGAVGSVTGPTSVPYMSPGDYYGSAQPTSFTIGGPNTISALNVPLAPGPTLAPNIAVPNYGVGGQVMSATGGGSPVAEQALSPFVAAPAVSEALTAGPTATALTESATLGAGLTAGGIGATSLAGGSTALEAGAGSAGFFTEAAGGLFEIAADLAPFAALF